MARSNSNSASPWLWLTLLLIVGGFVAFILFLDRGIVEQARLQPEDTVEAEPGKARGQPVFDFYRVLPDRKVEIPETEVIESKPRSDAGDKAPAGRARYLLQAGSFKAVADAERRKANLALLGLQARVDSADVQGVTYYRVLVGPFASDSDFSRAQRRLIENDIGFIRKVAK